MPSLQTLSETATSLIRLMIRDELVSYPRYRNLPVSIQGFGDKQTGRRCDPSGRRGSVKPEEGAGTLDGVVTHLIFKGVHYEMEVMAGGFEWLVHSTRHVPCRHRDVGIRVDPFDIQIMNKPESEDEEAVQALKNKHEASGNGSYFCLGCRLYHHSAPAWYFITGFIRFRTDILPLQNILAIASPEHMQGTVSCRSVLSLVSTLICLLLAYPLAMILANKSVNQNQFIVLIFILPMWMNFLLRTLAWQTLLEKTGVINSVLRFLSLPTLDIINTDAAIILGMVYNFLPFMVLPIFNSLSRMDQDLINAARDLGANNVKTFCRIIFPLSLPGVISGITMVFVPALTTFVISSLLGGSKILLIGNVIEQEFTQASNWNLGSGLSMVLMLFIILSMIVTAIFDKDGEGLM